MKAWVPVFALVLLAGCTGRGHNSVLREAERAQVRDPSGGVSSEPMLMLVRRVKVEGFEELPGFHVAQRTHAMEKFPCAKCHSKALPQLRREQHGKKAAHWEVKLEHAAAEVMDCATCHLEADLDSLATLKNTKVHMDHAYQVCAQCHSRQVADWAGGAHGKRLGGWAPPRVVSSCVECHNPHKPKLEQRLPAMAGRSTGR